MDFFGNAAVRINVIDCADGKDLAPGGFQAVEQRVAERLRGVVAAEFGAGKASGFFADERAGDNTADIIRLYIPVSNLAQFVQTLQPEMLLMGGNLQVAVG